MRDNDRARDAPARWQSPPAGTPSGHPFPSGDSMVTVICEFVLSPDFTPERARSVFLGSIDKFVNMKGLIRKYFLLSEDGKTGASVYLWGTRKPGEDFFTEAWKDFMV